jgi:uncharacterized protein (DUF302 family)
MNGLITVESAYSAAETRARLQSALLAAGMTVFSTIDHAEAAKQVGLTLRPTTVIAFGNPAAGTKLMQVNQMAGIDLPLKILLWEDDGGKAKLTYNDPAWIAERHELSTGTTPVITAMSNLLASLAEKAAKA